MTPQSVLNFWFHEIDPALWFRKSGEFDAKIRSRFYDLWLQAKKGELAHWRETMQGRLAEILVLDQFSRNLNRNSPDAFAQDEMAEQLTLEAIALPEFAQLSAVECQFLLLPLMHSEKAEIHEQAVVLFEKFAPHALDFEYKHKVIIDRFGRYPHRNQVLGRESTEEELVFLTLDGSSF